MALVGIYDSDGGVAGELRYAFGKLRYAFGKSGGAVSKSGGAVSKSGEGAGKHGTPGKQSGECSLCQITHGWNPLGKKSWKQALADSPVELKMIHRNEADETQLAATSGLPSIVKSTDGARVGGAGGGTDEADGASGWTEVISSSELTTFETSPEALLERLETLS